MGKKYFVSVITVIAIEPNNTRIDQSTRFILVDISELINGNN